LHYQTVFGNHPDFPLSGNYALANDIAASATEDWNEGEGFVPIARNPDFFQGILDGWGHVIMDLHILRHDL